MLSALCSQAVFREITPFSLGRKEGEPGPLRAAQCACLGVNVCSYFSAAGVRCCRARLGARTGRVPGPGPCGGARARSAPWRPRRGGAASPAAVRALPAARRLQAGWDPSLPSPVPCAGWAGGPLRRARRSEAVAARVRRRVPLAAAARMRPAGGAAELPPPPLIPAQRRVLKLALRAVPG